MNSNNHITLRGNETLTIHAGDKITFPCEWFFTLSKGEKLSYSWEYIDNTSYKTVYMTLEIKTIKVSNKFVYLRETYKGKGYKLGIFEQNNYLIKR